MLEILRGCRPNKAFMNESRTPAWLGLTWMFVSPLAWMFCTCSVDLCRKFWGLHALVNDVWGEWGIDNHYRDYTEHYEENPDEVPDVCVANNDGTFSHTYHLEDGTIELGSYRASAEHGLNSHTERTHDEIRSGAKYTIVLPQ